jgi:tetratricopeptide (TPR) repeat protein
VIIFPFIGGRRPLRFYVIAIACFMLLLPFLAYAQESTSTESSQKQNPDDAARATEESSSRDTRIDLSPPKDDAKNHPMSSTNPDAEDETPSDVGEMHPWDPHKAAKDVEVGDFYFRRKNYKGAIERYRHALIYKQNDAIAHFRLAESLDKTGESGEAIEHYKEYLKILPHGPNAEDAQKALARLNPTNAKASSKN